MPERGGEDSVLPGSQPSRGVRMLAGVPLWRQVGVVLLVATIAAAVLILLIGFVYVWKRGALRWD